MQTHKLNSLQLPECILTIGALDGLHKGHQTLILHARRRAREMEVPLVVYTFDPPPKVFFQRAMLLTPLDKKLTMLERMGVDHTIITPFNAKFMTQGTEAFLEELTKLNPREIFEGHDFRFGRNREGDINTLGKHFKVSILEPVKCTEGKVISSTRIRNLFAQGKIHEAYNLLNWSWLKETSFSSAQ